MNLESFLDCGTIFGIDRTHLLIGFGQRTWDDRPEPNEQRPSCYFPDFFLKQKRKWFTHSHWVEIDRNQVLNLLSSIKPVSTHKLEWEDSSYALFRTAFLDLQKRFHSKKLIKAVPFVFDTAKQQITREQLAHMLRKSIEYTSDHDAYLYGFWENGGGMLGATPELLFSMNSQKSILKTMACAGTTNSQMPLADIQKDVKLKQEHQIVVDSIISVLEPFGRAHTFPQTILSLPRLTHLVTPIEVNLHAEPLFESLVHALHPTPALGVYPQKEGAHWLEHYQTLIDRQRFGAPVGLKTSETSQCLVAIRNIQWDKSGARLGAGCGLIAESDLEAEWQEIRLKIGAIKEILGL